LLASSALAATTAPTLDYIYPAGVQSGATEFITLGGKFSSWPPQVWAGTPGITFRPEKAEKNAGQFSIEVNDDVRSGPHLIRVFNKSGASAPRILMVTSHPDATEAEPNDEIGKAVIIERWPLTINGRLNKSGDVDSYALQLESGQTLIASLDAFVLASPMDAVLRLVDSRGLEMALNHDGRTLDPFLTWTAKSAGTYILQVFAFAHPATADVRFTGSDACVYRLHLSRGPQARYTLPLGLPRATQARLRLFGWNLGRLSGREFAVDCSSFPNDARQAPWHIPEVENSLILPVTDGPELLEPDFARGTKDDAAPSVPFAVTGAIETIGEEDRYRFSAAKDDKLLLEIQAASLGFPLDAWLAIEDANGKELARNDDGAAADPVLEWSAPETGSYIAVVGSVLHRAGPDYLYRLSTRPARPTFTGIIAESSFTVGPGKTTRIKVTARQAHGFKSKLTATVTGLPEGVTAAPVAMGESDKDITLEIVASGDALPFSGRIEIQFREDESEATHPAVFELITTSRRNGVPQGFPDLLIRSTNQLWLTVLPAPEPPLAEEKSTTSQSR
jgi:hypothetical protein